VARKRKNDGDDTPDRPAEPKKKGRPAGHRNPQPQRRGTRNGRHGHAPKEVPSVEALAEWLKATLSGLGGGIDCPSGIDFTIDDTEGDMLDWVELWMEIEDAWDVPVEQEHNQELCASTIRQIAVWIKENASRGGKGGSNV
jgi:hypothetical protein